MYGAATTKYWQQPSSLARMVLLQQSTGNSLAV